MPYADEASRRYEEQERVAQRNALEDLEALKTEFEDLKADRDRLYDAVSLFLSVSDWQAVVMARTELRRAVEESNGIARGDES